MVRLATSLAIVAALTASASANWNPHTAAHEVDTSMDVPEPPEPHQFALAINEPLGWADKEAIGISGYAGLTDHQAIHLNVATYDPGFTPTPTIAGAIAGGGFYGNGIGGRTTDIGAAWMYFPRRLYDGFSVELGIVNRWQHRNIWVDDDAGMAQDSHTFEIAARALVGWSWIIHRRAFFSLQAGFSVGGETGTETQANDDMPTVTTHIAQASTTLEGIGRFGIAFDLL